MAEHGNAAGLPSGLVTFVFTDIEGSTRLFRSLGDGAVPVFEKHNALLREAWNAHGGHEVSTEGDSFFVAFDDAGAAFAACVDAQRKLAAAVWPEGVRLRARMGIHTGLAAPRNDNYVALAVHRAARVMHAGHGGQIIVTESTVKRGPVPAGARFTPIGQYRIRDFDDPPQLYRLDATGFPENLDPIRATPADHHNLVRAMTSFIGRNDEALAVNELLGPGQIVTLAGPGGVGKTRLAAEIGASVAEAWADGVWMVELAELFDSELVVEEIASTLGVSAVSADSRWDDVLDHLADRHALIILDNIEQHVETCAALVPDLLARCDGVGVLATGREQMNLTGEKVFRVRSLHVPEPGAAKAIKCAAVQLFVDRAQAAKPDFELAPDHVDDVVRICAHLDGLPLAIEIAAARVAMLSVEEIRSGLSNRFRLLQSRDRSLPARQRTMEGLLGWSYQLLNEQERAALRRLAVFAGGFTVGAAVVALTTADLEHGATDGEAAELVWALIDKSLIVVDRTESATRYRLPESVQDYAMRLLVDTDDPVRVAITAAGWFLERIAPWNVVDRRWLGEVGMELPNLRGLVDLLADAAPETAQQLVCSLGRYHDSVQSFHTGVEELTRAAAELTARTPTRVALLATLADMHLRQANVIAAQQLLDDARELESDVGVAYWSDAAVARSEGELAARAGNHAEAERIANAALAGELSAPGQARMWNLMGIARFGLHDAEGARDAFAHALELFVELKFEATVASAHANMAEASLVLGDHRSAAQHQQACLDDALALGQPVMIAYSLIVASRLAGASADWQLASRLQSAADAILASTGHELYPADIEEMANLRRSAVAAIGKDAAAACRGEGQQLTTLEAAALARDVLVKTAARNPAGCGCGEG